MSIFSTIGLVVNSAGEAATELCSGVTTIARTINKTASMAEKEIDALLAEQDSALAELQKSLK